MLEPPTAWKNGETQCLEPAKLLGRNGETRCLEPAAQRKAARHDASSLPLRGRTARQNASSPPIAVDDGAHSARPVVAKGDEWSSRL